MDQSGSLQGEIQNQTQVNILKEKSDTLAKDVLEHVTSVM